LLLAAGAVTVAGAGGLWLAVARQRDKRWARPVRRAQPFAPSVYLSIDREGAVTVYLIRSEMGQGVMTALPMMIAEELDADWSRVRVEQAVESDAHDHGPMYTAASASVISTWTELRRAGSAARAMLIDAAADVWNTRTSRCRTEAGVVIHVPTGRRLPYGDLVDRAAGATVPLRPRLKRPEDFRILGKPLPRLDVPAKVTGKARFGLDVVMPGLRRAVVVLPPAFGAKIVNVDDAAARAVPGVEAIVPIEGGVAVVASNTFSALEGRAALRVTWSEGTAPSLTTADVVATLRGQADQAGTVARALGDPLAALAAGKRIEADYTAPYLAHATMEPPNCTASVRDGRCEIWAPTQDPGGLRAMAARVTRLPLAAVTVNVTLLGGGFGRRTNLREATHAVEVARAVGHPVQVLWTREDDLRQGHYREAAFHRLTGALDASGRPGAWRHRIVTASSGWSPPDGEVDRVAIGGAASLPYTLPAQQIEWRSAKLAVPVGIWRSVGYSHAVFAVESFLDELCAAGGRDPVELRLDLLREAPRLRACLATAAERAGWGRPLPSGRGRGVAVATCFGSNIALVAEVSPSADGGPPRIHRVVAAIDCGTVVNPDIVAAQVEGGVMFGLAAALHGRIDLDRGGITQSNFHDHPLLRIDEAPMVDAILMPSAAPPGGVGEVAVPPVAPAVANALFAASGRRVRDLPFTPRA
jgi:isoquinoline 1-oxidoreductase beta subunit